MFQFLLHKLPPHLLPSLTAIFWSRLLSFPTQRTDISITSTPVSLFSILPVTHERELRQQLWPWEFPSVVSAIYIMKSDHFGRAQDFLCNMLPPGPSCLPFCSLLSGTKENIWRWPIFIVASTLSLPSDCLIWFTLVLPKNELHLLRPPLCSRLGSGWSVSWHYSKSSWLEMIFLSLSRILETLSKITHIVIIKWGSYLHRFVFYHLRSNDPEAVSL